MAVRWRGDEAKAEIVRRADAMAARVADQLLKWGIVTAPFDTGALMQSGEVRKLGAASYVVAFPLYYAHFVEFGTIQNAPNPFLRTAVEYTIPFADKVYSGG